MAKEIVAQIKLQAPGGQATPAPPIGPALGQQGINIGQFVSQFNERTKDLNGTIVPVVITVYKDKSFTFEVKSPPAAVLLKQAAEIAKGSGTPNKEKVGKITTEQLRKIAETKFKDLNAYDLERAKKIIEGTARSMGIEIVSSFAEASAVAEAKEDKSDFASFSVDATKDRCATPDKTKDKSSDSENAGPNM